MKVTCLGLGVGQGAMAGPACHLLKISSTQLLLECPLELSTLLYFLPTVVSPHSGREDYYIEYDGSGRSDKLQKTSVGLEGRKPPAPQATRNNYTQMIPPFKAIEGHALLDVEPMYKTADLGLVDISSLNSVLISNPEGMLGLPYLTRMQEFSGQVFVTSATAKIGQLLMEELVAMHGEYIQIFGHTGLASPFWLQPVTLAAAPKNVKRALVDDDGVGRANWHWLYSKNDIDTCMKKVHCLHYGEEVNIDDCLVIKPCSSGNEIGSCNWVISGSKGRFSYLSASEFTTSHAMGLNLSPFEGTDVLFFSDLKSSRVGVNVPIKDTGNAEIEAQDFTKVFDKRSLDIKVKKTRCESQKIPAVNYTVSEGLSNSSTSFSGAGSSGATGYIGPFKLQSSAKVAPTSASSKAGKMGIHKMVEPVWQKDLQGDMKDKLPIVCRAVADAVKKGGSVLVTISRFGAQLELLEEMAQCLQDSNQGGIPMFYISPSAEESLVFANTVPEWLCNLRQEKLYSGEALFGHVELLSEKRLHRLPALHSTELVNVWQEPCVVFAAHWSLRMGPVVHLLHRWRQNPLCLLVMTQADIDVDLALCPFKPIAMQILQYPIADGLRAREVTSIVQSLKPKIALLPEKIRSDFTEIAKAEANPKGSSILFYDKGDTITIPGPKEIEVDMSADLAIQIQPMQSENGQAVARLSMSLQLKNGRWSLEPPTRSEFHRAALSSVPFNECCWGRVEKEDLIRALKDRGMYCISASESDGVRGQRRDDDGLRFVVVVTSPSPAKVECTPESTLIETDDPVVRRLISDAVRSLLHVL